MAIKSGRVLRQGCLILESPVSPLVKYSKQVTFTINVVLIYPMQVLPVFSFLGFLFSYKYGQLDDLS